MVSVGVTTHVAFVDVVVVVGSASRRVSNLEPVIPVASTIQSDRQFTRLWQRRAEIVTRYQPGIRLNPKIQPWPGL
jgi:hypothetical protein